MNSGFLWRTLNFALPRQEGDSWCWAACASAVSAYFNPSTTWSQCAVAAATLGKADCCDDPGACDHPSYVHHALESTGNLAMRQEGPVSRDELVAELKRERPVVVRIQYPNLGHFVVVDGFRLTVNRSRLKSAITVAMFSWKEVRRSRGRPISSVPM